MREGGNCRISRRGSVPTGLEFKVPIQGVSNHQDFAGTGTAVPDRVNAFRVKGLRDIGVNAWRTAHNPTVPELLDFADDQGMLMWVENRFINTGVQPILSSKDVGAPLPSSVAVADAQLLLDAQNMVLRDRNHPSVIIWCAPACLSTIFLGFTAAPAPHTFCAACTRLVAGRDSCS